MTAFQLYLASPKTRSILNRKPWEKGFSLIELVVVVAVLAILAAIAIPAFTSINDKAAVSAAQNTLVQIVKECAVKKANGEDQRFNAVNLNSYRVTPATGDCAGTAGTPSRITCTGTQVPNGADGKCDGPLEGAGMVTATKTVSAADLPNSISVNFSTGEKTCNGGSSKFCNNGVW